jgi:hypothetical protein
MNRKSKPRGVVAAEAQPTSVDLFPNAWQRFERAVDAAIKSGPKHKTAAKPKGNKAPPKVHEARVPERKSALSQ